MDDLAQLEHLSLISAITRELQNHLSISDSTIAEYVVDQFVDASGPDDFKARMAAFEFPDSLTTSVSRLIKTMHPKFKSQARNVSRTNGEDEDEQGGRAKKFRGLAIPDRNVQDTSPSPSPSADEKDGAGAMDDTFALLEGLAPEKKTGVERNNGSSRKRSASPERNGHDDRRSRKYRRRSISRSRSRSRNDRKDDYVFEDEFGRTRTWKANGRDRNGKDERRPRAREDRYARQPTPELDDEPIVFKIYSGRVTGVKDFGVFVNLYGVRGRVDGLVHVSAMAEGKVNHPSDLVSFNQEVKVKVMKVQDKRISLSMAEVDQETGDDLAPHKRINAAASGANAYALGGEPTTLDRYGNLTTTVPVIEGSNAPRKQRKRMTSPERWEIKQLVASGALKAADYPDLDEDYNAAMRGEEIEEEEDVDIEVREEEPPFLQGQTKQSLELSPIRVVKAPDGSLNRAAMNGDVLAKERRDLRAEEARDKVAKQTAEADLQQQWADPMARPEDRKFASDIAQQKRGGREEEPEWKKVSRGTGVSFGKRTSMSIKDQRESLPAFKMRKQFLDAVREYQLLIVVGDTGSGKTTQLTQYLAEDGFANTGMIGCTQPRRVAAMSVAQRVSDEVGCRLGQEVGYTVRFDDKSSHDTKIKYMTDGILQREILLDPTLSKYSVIMLDEAHERTIATDVLFGLLKKTLKKRPDLKVIVTSATLDADKFSEYFLSCPILTIPGRTFPVEVMYSREPESDYLDAALTTAMQIHLTEPPGDILLFLTGKEEIDTSCEVLYERMKALGPSVPELMILPIYGALPSEIASRIFEPAPVGTRKMVIATNIAETSITIDGIYFVIDPGFVKQTAYDAKLGMDRLQVTPISQAQAKQRAGRAGRTGPGKCFRLYTETAYQAEMLPTTIPEIQRQNLSNTILMLKAMGINDLLHFDFMDPPPTNTMLTALEELYALSALDEEGLLTRLGRRMADFPMEPALAKSLIMSVDLGCSDELLSIVAMISASQSVFYRPKEKQNQADQKKAKFHDPSGDHLTLLNVYQAWLRQRRSDAWCQENFIMPRAMKRAEDVRKQLVQILDRHRLRVVSCGRDTTRVRQALCSGFFRSSARKDPTEGYKTLVEATPVYMHPSSALWNKNAEYVVYHSLVETTREYLHIVSTIEPKWLVELAPTFFKVAGREGGLSRRQRAERVKPLAGRGTDGDEWRLSAQRKQGRAGGGTWG
ncbi:hypothetical protein ANO11243_031200 [Dothideomycetidae sp. 11243]|nr:hypothetical protein ANO11243_031200 [fungal sp. No.11243]